MKIIVGNPGSGKTRALLELSESKNIAILCENEARVDRLVDKARGYGITIPMPITINQITPNVKEVLIDDVSRLFEVAFNVKVEGITINRDNSVEVQDLDK